MMQKVKNVIKIISILFPLVLFSQKKIEGKYYIYNENHFHGISTNITFFKNGTFLYNQSQDFGNIDYGKGHYQIKNDSLILNYDLTELKINDYHKYKYYQNNKDSVEIKINVHDLNDEIIPKHPILILSEKIDFESNKNGQIRFKLKKEKKKIEVSVPNALFGYQIKIWKNRNYEIDVFLNMINSGTAIKNQIVRYKILEQTDDFIKLKSNSGIIKLVKQSE